MRFYLDSMIWIYALEGNTQFGPRAQTLLRQIRADGHTLLTSHFLLAEILVAPYRRGDSATITAYRKMLTSLGVEVVLLAPTFPCALQLFGRKRKRNLRTRFIWSCR